MSTSSSDADDAPPHASPDEADGVNPWVVRLFLILAFGVAFGIEGMTLVRSYLLDGEADESQAVVEEEEAPGSREGESSGAPLRVGDDLLPATDVTERVAQMQIRAQASGPWTFRLVVAVRNDREASYRLVLRRLETDDGTVRDEARTVTCAPGDSTRLVATWPMSSDARPRALTTEGKVQIAGDSARTTSRRVRFGHVPVQMQR
jgi:hypothetical protein